MSLYTSSSLQKVSNNSSIAIGNSHPLLVTNSLRSFMFMHLNALHPVYTSLMGVFKMWLPIFCNYSVERENVFFLRMKEWWNSCCFLGILGNSGSNSTESSNSACCLVGWDPSIAGSAVIFSEVGMSAGGVGSVAFSAVEGSSIGKAIDSSRVQISIGCLGLYFFACFLFFLFSSHSRLGAVQ